MRPGKAAGLAALLALTGCGAVKVTRLSPDAGTAPRPPDCALEFLDKAPERAYDEVAELDSHLTAIPPGGPLEVLREPACRLGADAVVVIRRFVTNELGHMLVAGTAIKYRAEVAPPPRQEGGQPAPLTD
jgi:hypothetical protein